MGLLVKNIKYHFSSAQIQKIESTFLGLLIFILSVFVLIFFKGPIGLDGHLDSWVAIVDQFQLRWLDVEGIDKFDYFFSPSNWPHPKIILRIFTVFDYYVFSNISMYRIDLYCNLGILLTVFLIYRIWCVKKIILLIPIASIFLIVTRSNYWTVLSVGIGYSYLISILLFYCVFTRRHMLAFLLIFLAVFRSGAGFLILIPLSSALLYLLYKKELDIKNFILYLLVVLFNLVIFYNVTLGGSFVSNRIKEFDVPFIERIGSLFMYYFQVAGSFPISEVFLNFESKYLKVFLGFLISASYLYQLIKSDKSNTKVRIGLCVGLYYILLCAIAAAINDNPEMLFEGVQNRYTHFSIWLWSSVYLIFISSFERLRDYRAYLIPIIILFTINFFIKSYNSFDFFPKFKENKTEGFFNALVGDVKSLPVLIANKEAKLINLKKIYYDGVKNELIKPYNFERIYNEKFDKEALDFSKKGSGKGKYFFSKFEDLKLLKIDILTLEKTKEIFVETNGVIYKAERENRKMNGFNLFLFYLPAPINNETLKFYNLKNDQLESQEAILDYSRYYKSKKYRTVKNNRDMERILDIEEAFYANINSSYHLPKKDFKMNFSKQRRYRNKEVKALFDAQ